MADDEKKRDGPDTPKDGEASEPEFTGIEGLGDDDWAGALDEWDSSVDLEDAGVPAEGARPPEPKPESKPEPEPAPSAEEKPVAQASPPALPNAAAAQAPPDGPEEGAEEDAPLLGDDLDLEVESGEALGEMLSAESEVTLTVDDEFYDDFTLDDEDEPEPEPVPEPESGADAFDDDLDAALGALDEELGASPLTEPDAEEPAAVEPSAEEEPEEPELIFEAEAPDEDDEGPELIFEAEEPDEYAEAPELTFEEDGPEDLPEEPELSFEEEEPEPEGEAGAGLSSLDAMLGLDEVESIAEEAPALEPEQEGDGEMASLDALLGAGDGGEGTAAVGAVPADAKEMSAVGFDLPEPPPERQLGELQQLADAESHPTELPGLDGLEPRPERPPLAGMPETLEPAEDEPTRFAELAELLAEQAEQAEHPRQAATLLTGAGELLELRLGKSAEALERYLEASTLDSEHRGCRRALVRCALTAEDWGAALEALEVLADSGGDTERGAYQTLAATLALSTMGDTERAQKLYVQLAETERYQYAGLLGQLDVAVLDGDADLLAKTLARLSEAIAASELRTPVALEAARRLEAVEDDPGAATAYERAAAGSGELAEVARVGLARLAARDGQWELAAERLSSLLNDVDAGGHRSDAAVSLARLQARRLNRLEEALVTLESAAQEAPHRLGLQLRLARLAQEAGQWSQAAEAWSAAAEAAQDPSLSATCTLQAGLVREQRLDDGAAALADFRAAHERDPTLSVVGVAVGDVLGRSADAEERLEARLARASAAEEPAEEGAERLLAARELLGVDRPDEALQLLASARAKGLDGRGLLRQTEQLAAAQGDLDQACDVLLQRAQLEEPEAAAAARLRSVGFAARSRSAERHRPYDEVREVDASLEQLAWGAQRAMLCDPDADWESAVVAEAESAADPARAARLWRLVGLSRQWGGADGDRITAPLERALELQADEVLARELLATQRVRDGQWAAAARLLGEAGDVASSVTQAALLLLRQAVCLEQKCDAVDEAADLYQVLGERWPAWSLPLDTLVRLRVWSGDRLQTAQILQAQAAQAADESARLELLVRAATELDCGGDLEAAAGALKEALALAPEDPVPRAHLDQLEDELGNWAAIADRALTIAKDADADDDAARLAAYEELARIDRDGREDFPSAILGYESIVRLAVDHHASLRELELYYPAEQRFAELGTICAKIARATAGAERAANALEWARYRQAANQAGERVEALRLAVEAAPDSLFALARLEGHALQNGWLSELASIHRAVAEQYRESATAQAVFLRRAAESYEAAGEDAEALEALTQAVEIAPDYLPGAQMRLRLELRAEHWEGAAAAAEALATAVRRPEARAAALSLAGALAFERLEDGERAATNFAAVLELKPEHHVAYDRLRELYEKQQRWTELAELVEARIPTAASADDSCELLWELAQVQRDRLADPEGAKATLKRLISMDVKHLEAVRAATALYEADEQWVEMAGMLIRQAREEKAPERLAEIFFVLGVLYDEKIPDAKRAAASFSKVVSINPQNLQALRRLSVIHVQNEEWKSALAVTGRLVETEQDPEHRVDHLITLSKILEGGYRDPRRAREALLKAVEVDPRNLKAVGELAQFYGRQKDRRSLMVHLDRSVTNVRGQLAANPFDPEAYRALLKLFEWRRAPDQQACAAAALSTIGAGGDREREILATVGRNRPRLDVLKDPELEEVLYPAAVQSGFRHTMRLLGPSLSKPYRDDLSSYGAGRSTRVPKSGHPLRDVANQIAQALEVAGFDLHIVKDRPEVLAVEPFDPPAILVGENLVGSTDSAAEMQFILGRCLKLIQASMVLPAKLDSAQLQALVAGIVRQYQADFEPPEVPPKDLVDRTKVVAKAMPRKVKSELMPFALGCAGITDFEALNRDVVRMANMAGLLSCGDLTAACNVLLRMAGRSPGSAPFAKLAKSVWQVEQLLLFSVSEEYFELRQRVGLSTGSGPRF